MCGVFAVLQRGRPLDAGRARRALASLLHRGPDGHALEFSELAPRRGRDDATTFIALAHARLAILDPTARSDQPFTRGDRSIVYNGEIYDFRAIRSELAARGARFETTGDTETLLHLIDASGLDGLRRANGMWAFVLLDRGRRRLLAARDRYGKKPLFWHIDSDRIVLASGMHAIHTMLGTQPMFASGVAETFLAHGWLLPRGDGSTHVEGIREVRPGHALELDLDTWAVTERRVAGLDFGIGSDPPSDDELAATLEDAVRLRLVSDRRVGLMLSGGVDSTLILSILARRGEAGSVTCFVGEAGKSEDAAWARRALAALGQDAHEVALDYGPAGFDRFLDVCRHQEKPFPLIGNVLGLPALYQAAAEAGVRVVLDGTGADEIFAGYWQRHAVLAMRDAARADDEAWLERVRAGGHVPDELMPLDRAALADCLPMPMAERLPARDLSYLGASTREGIREAAPTDPLAGFRGSLAEALKIDASRGRMQEWLWQNDRNAMAFGVENRSPFLDPRLARWCASGYAAKLDAAWNKRELRALFERFVLLPTASRPAKQGFRWVYGRFLRSNRARLLDMLSASKVARRMLESDRLWTDMRTDETVLEMDLVQRLIVLAALETVGFAIA